MAAKRGPSSAATASTSSQEAKGRISGRFGFGFGIPAAGLRSDHLPADGLSEHLLQRAKNAVAGALGKRGPPGCDLRRHEPVDAEVTENMDGLT